MNMKRINRKIKSIHNDLTHIKLDWLEKMELNLCALYLNTFSVLIVAYVTTFNLCEHIKVNSISRATAYIKQHTVTHV